MAARTRAVVDASCLLRALLDDSEDAFRWLEGIQTGRVDARAPDLVYAEVAHGLLRQTRSGKLTHEQAGRALETVVLCAIDTTPARVLVESALAVALDRGVTAYDAHYIALAEAEDAVLVTADRRLADAASRSILLE